MLFDMKNDKLLSVDISGDTNYKNIVEHYSKKLKEMRDFSEKSIF